MIAIAHDRKICAHSLLMKLQPQFYNPIVFVLLPSVRNRTERTEQKRSNLTTDLG
jgi:hypothetical protein